MCFIPEGNIIEEGMMESYPDKIKNKWIHCMECGPCLIRFSMVQMNGKVRAVDMRVIIVEFFKAIGQTALLTQDGIPDGGVRKTMNHFKRTCFGLLSHKQKPSKPGYSCSIDFLQIDETTFEGKPQLNVKPVSTKLILRKI